MSFYQSFQGTVTMINDIRGTTGSKPGCYIIMTVEDRSGSVVNFVVNPMTYFVDHVTLSVGDEVIGFYDANAPVPLIYPPQFQAIVMAMLYNDQFVTVDFFNRQLVNPSNTLKLNIGPNTQVLLTNDQTFSGSLMNRDLIVVYSFTTRSIPAQTTPIQVIVLC